MSQADRLYKYTMVQFAKGMVEHGRFRLGTLYEYRRVEKHGVAVGDAEEGTHKTILDAKRPTSFSLYVFATSSTFDLNAMHGPVSNRTREPSSGRFRCA